MLVPTWELGVVLVRGHNKILACVGAVVFRKLEDRRTVINLGFINYYKKFEFPRKAQNYLFFLLSFFKK